SLLQIQHMGPALLPPAPPRLALASPQECPTACGSRPPCARRLRLPTRAMLTALNNCRSSSSWRLARRRRFTDLRGHFVRVGSEVAIEERLVPAAQQRLAQLGGMARLLLAAGEARQLLAKERIGHQL